MTEQEQLAIRSAAHSWMKHQGYTDDDIAVAETDTHEASGCEWCPNHMTWDCIDEETGQSRHPAWDALDDAVQVVQFLGDLGYRKPREITTIEELDALPSGSTILDQNVTAIKADGVWWFQVGPFEPNLPVAVLYTPEEPR